MLLKIHPIRIINLTLNITYPATIAGYNVVHAAAAVPPDATNTGLTVGAVNPLTTTSVVVVPSCVARTVFVVHVIVLFVNV